MVANFRHGSSKPSTVAGFADWMVRTERWLRQLDNRIASKAGGAGAKGDPGVGVADIVEEPAGTLTFEMTDGTEEGPFELPPGPQGEPGPVGPAGASGAPVGSVVMWPVPTPPSGWLVCNGGTINADAYPELVALLGSTTLPDMRTRFPLGARDNSTVGNVGGSNTITAEQMPTHNHGMSHTHGMGHNHGTTGGQSQNHDHAVAVKYLKTTTTGGSATRVTDVANVSGADGTYKQGRTGVASQSHQHSVGGASSTTTGGASATTTGDRGSGSTYWQPYKQMHFIIRATAEDTA